MSTPANLRKRLEKLEAPHQVSAPTDVFKRRPLKEGEAEEALANWEAWVADGRATIMGQTLIIETPRMSREEWLKATAYRRGEAIH